MGRSKKCDKGKGKKKKKKEFNTVAGLKKELWRREMQRKSAWANYYELINSLVETKFPKISKKRSKKCNSNHIMKALIMYTKDEKTHNITCPICLVKFNAYGPDTEENLHYLNCGHLLCKSCANELDDRGMNKCPTCRKIDH